MLWTRHNQPQSLTQPQPTCYRDTAGLGGRCKNVQQRKYCLVQFKRHLSLLTVSTAFCFFFKCFCKSQYLYKYLTVFWTLKTDLPHKHLLQSSCTHHEKDFHFTHLEMTNFEVFQISFLSCNIRTVSWPRFPNNLLHSRRLMPLLICLFWCKTVQLLFMWNLPSHRWSLSTFPGMSFNSLCKAPK